MHPERGARRPVTPSAGRRCPAPVLGLVLVVLPVLALAACAPRARRQPPPPVQPPAPSASSQPEPSAPPEAAAQPLPADCDGLRRLYRERLEAATSCIADADCHVVSGDCAVGLEGCWHVVNRTLTSEDTAAISARFVELGCTGPVCRCAPPPAHARCDDGTCVAD